MNGRYRLGVRRSTFAAKRYDNVGLFTGLKTLLYNLPELRWPWLGLIGVLLIGCETAPPKITYTEVPDGWASRIQQLNTVDTWELKGKLAVIQADRSDSLLINKWLQRKQAFDIHVSSALLGIGATQISGTPQHLTLAQPDEPVLYSDNPEGLLTEALGWSLPLNSIHHWMKGVPAPDQPATIRFDDAGNPHEIVQSQWLVRLDRFQAVDQLVLPKKITLTRDQVKVKVVVTEWSIASDAAGS